MKVIILCGGTGTRLKEETEYKPKPMVHIGNQPILWHIMKIYASYGYNEFILALGYKADYIKDYFLNQKAFTSDFSLETRHHKTKFYLDERQDIDNFKITFVDTGLETLPGERILRCQKYIPKNDKYFIIEDRKEAITEALSMANENSTILISGRGHERFQKIGNEKIAFNDCEVVRRILSGLE